MTETLSISEIARRAGVATSTVRYYDRLGLVAAAERDGNGRRYHPDVLKRLFIIRYFQQAGFSLAETVQLLDGAGEWQARAQQKRDELAERREELTMAQQLIDAALACGCTDLQGCDAHDEIHPLTMRSPSPQRRRS